MTKKALTGPATFPLEFQVASEGPVAICAVVRSVCGQARTFPLAWWFVHPVRESLRRAEQVSGYLNIPQDTAAADLAAKAAAMERDEAQSGPKTAARLDLYRQARWLARQAAMANPRMDFDKLLFVKRFTQETYNDVNLNHLPWVSRPGGDICVLSPVAPDGQVTNLLHGALGPGHVHGMDLWYDARSVVFGYARSASAEPPPGWLDRSNTYEIRKKHEATHLYEIGADGRGLRQLTGGVWSDLDPTYLPSGEIAFVSERCGASLQCNEYDKDETSCNLYVMKSGGEGIRRLSASKDGDYLPHTFDDGTIGYTRWEYQERGWANIQSIWYIRPDGTGADALYKQHMNDPWALEDTRSIPGTDKYISIACGHHTIAEGPLVVIDPSGGINNPHGIDIVTPDIRSLEGGMSGSPAPEGGTADGGGTYMTPGPCQISASSPPTVTARTITPAASRCTWSTCSAQRSCSIATRQYPARRRSRSCREASRRCSSTRPTRSRITPPAWWATSASAASRLPGRSSTSASPRAWAGPTTTSTAASATSPTPRQDPTGRPRESSAPCPSRPTAAPISWSPPTRPSFFNCSTKIRWTSAA